MKEHICNIYIVKSNLGSKESKSYNQIKMCMCIDVWWIYMVANLILLCSLKTYLSFGTQKILCKKTWAILFISFLGGHLSTHCFRYLGYLSIFSQLFFMKNFCIAPCFFSTTKLLRDNNKNLEHLFDGKPIKHVFSVLSQCKSKTFLGGSRWNACFCAYPHCKSSAYLGGAYVILILRV